MAGILNNILGYLKLNDDEDYEDDFLEEEEEDFRDEPPVRTRRPERQDTVSHRSRRSYASSREEEDYEDELATPIRKERISRADKGSKVIPMRTTARGLEVRIMKPSSFEDSQEVCEILLSGRAVVVNLEGFDADDAQRIMDFISGCIFAVKGNLHRISKYIFIFSPDNVDISGDYLDILPEDKMSAMTINKEF